MKSAYKWRITNSKYVYITDEYNYGPFIYDKTTQTRVYENMGTVERADDAVIADVVSELTLEEYTERFNQMKILMESDEETSRVKLLDVSYYYDFNNDECVLKAAEPECEGYTPIISISATSLNYDEQPTANVEVFYSDIDKTVRYNVTVGIPKGEKGDQGSAGTGSTIQISMYPNGEGTYDRPVHTQYIEEDATYQGLYDHLHLAPITDGNVIDEKSCVKDGQVVTFVEDSILTIDYKETNVQNINASGDMNIGGNIEVSGTTNIYGQLTVQSGITAAKDITTEGNISGKTITATETLISNGNLTVQGNSNIGGNSIVSGDLSVVGNTNLNGTTNINGDITLSETAKTTIGQIAVPVGTIMLWPTYTPPQGWLLCDGSENLEIYDMVPGDETNHEDLAYPTHLYIAQPSGNTSIDDDNRYYKKNILLLYRTLEQANTQYPQTLNNVNVIWKWNEPYMHYETENDKHIWYNCQIIDAQYISYSGETHQVHDNGNTAWRTFTTEVKNGAGGIIYSFNVRKNQTINTEYEELIKICKYQFNEEYNQLLYSKAVPNSSNKIYLTQPNLTYSFVYGASSDNLIGSFGGSEKVKLEGKNLPPHTHELKWPENLVPSSSENAYTLSGDTPNRRAVYANSGSGDYWEDENNKKPLKAESFSILPPYMVLNYIIKYK